MSRFLLSIQTEFILQYLNKLCITACIHIGKNSVEGLNINKLHVHAFLNIIIEQAIYKQICGYVFK